MNKQLKEYQQFIDSIVGINKGVLSNWIEEKKFPEIDENKKIIELLNKLSQEEREVLAEIVDRARSGGIHDFLVQLQDKVNNNDLKIISGGVELANEPYGTPLNWDWVCRREGDEWPDEDELKEDYK